MKQEDDFVVCRCENVYYSELLNIMENGANNSRELKLKSRAGMGFCASRTCGPLLERLTGDQHEDSPGYIHLKSQPPIRTISMKELSGEGDT
ncbi:(2Fe-2S)-binding protein [Salinicoccus carnicancri]|uniref:(2Fe-2S)-binding protein n=1 Tax=Salinicoccus carnicancri TaxID=558170 RepID=UPI000317DAC7|nr:(2Fe-2S)-binding protein [Salinicoccus carnicancri]